jgi:hypothetical protein
MGKCSVFMDSQHVTGNLKRQGQEMESDLSDEEEQFVRDLLAWAEKRRPIEWIFNNLLLFLGGTVVVIGLLTVQYLNDRTVYCITVPGFLLGFLLIGLYIIGERRLVARVLGKLWGER